MLRIWTVYKHPKDYPDQYVARMFSVDADGHRPTKAVFVADTLEQLQQKLEDMHLVKLMRSPEDDPVIVETWL